MNSIVEYYKYIAHEVKFLLEGTKEEVAFTVSLKVFPKLEAHHNLVTMFALLILSVILSMYFMKRKFKPKDERARPPLSLPMRFRKRDKLRYFVNQYSRRLQTVTGKLSQLQSQQEKQQFMSRFARRLLHIDDEEQRPLFQRLPASFFEANNGDEEEMDVEADDVRLCLASVHVFGQLEKRHYLQLFKCIEIVPVPAGHYLFTPGEEDSHLYVVRAGLLHILNKEPKTGEEHVLNEVGRGGNVYSLLSVMDVLAGQQSRSRSRSVYVRAVTDSEVIRLSAKAFLDIFKSSPHTLLRIVQIICVRLGRVTFLALYNYLGLSQELVNKRMPLGYRSETRRLHRSWPAPSSGHAVDRGSFSIETSDGHRSKDKPKKRTVVHPSATQWKPVPRTVSTGASIGPPGKLCRSHSPAGLQGIRLPPEPVFGPMEDSVSDTSSTSRSSRRQRIRRHQSTTLENATSSSEGEDVVPRAVKEKQVLLSEVESDLDLGEAAPLNRQEKDTHPSPIDDTFTPEESLFTDASRKIHIFQNKYGAAVKATSSTEDPVKMAESWLGLSESQLNALLDAAYKDLVTLFGLHNRQLLEGKLSVTVVPPGTTLVQQGEEDAGLFLIVAGEVHCFLHPNQTPPAQCASLFVSQVGELLNSLSTVSREASLFTLRALRPGAVVGVEASLFYHLVHSQASVALNVARCFVRRLSPFLRQIDYALEWVSIKAGRTLYKQNDPAHSVYIVLHGRLRHIHEGTDGEKKLVEEVGRGELVGLLEALSHQARVTTLLAVRDSEVARIPVGLLETIKYRAPHVVSRLIQLLSDRLLHTITGSLCPRRGEPATHIAGPERLFSSTGSGARPTSTLNEPNLIQGHRLHRSLGNIRTVAVLPTTSEVPLEPFVLELQHALNTIGSSLRLTSRIILRRLGQKALDSANEYKLCSWLSRQEDTHRMLFYVCDPHPTTVWTRRCIRQADCVLVVALADNPTPSHVTHLESAVNKDSVKVNRMLVLLYPEEVEYPPMGRTARWLEKRPWIQQHFHIRCPRRTFTANRLCYSRLMQRYKQVHEQETPSQHCDLSRLARYLTDTSVGLVLGGGGARGASHVGVIRGLWEAGIPIDMVGGTSIGSFMGALWAEETRLVQFTQRARAFFKDMSSVWRTLMDVTYPAVAFLSGKAFNSALEKVFKRRQIEDLWLPYFCITTDITNSRMRIHTEGSVWRYVRASMSFPVAVPPICDPVDGALLVDGAFVNNMPGSLWRYVRASMSLSGYLPPLCDPLDHSLLLDGGYVNNLPADIMSSMGLATIFAVDVGSVDDRDHTNYGDHLSGWSLLYSRFFRRKNPIRVPGMTEIQSRLAYVSCVRQLELVKASGLCEYVRPQIEAYQTLQFGGFEEISEVGYKCIREKIEEWRNKGTLAYYQRKEHPSEDGTMTMTQPDTTAYQHTTPVEDILLGNQTKVFHEQRQFIDLAELVSHMDNKPRNRAAEEELEDEYDDDVDHRVHRRKPHSTKRHRNKEMTHSGDEVERGRWRTRGSFSSEAGGYQSEEDDTEESPEQGDSATDTRMFKRPSATKMSSTPSANVATLQHLVSLPAGNVMEEVTTGKVLGATVSDSELMETTGGAKSLSSSSLNWGKGSVEELAHLLTPLDQQEVQATEDMEVTAKSPIWVSLSDAPTEDVSRDIED